MRFEIVSPFFPFHLEPFAVPRVNEFVAERVLHVFLGHEPVLAQDDAEPRVETARHRLVARFTLHPDRVLVVSRRARRGRWAVGAVLEQGDVRQEESDNRTYPVNGQSYRLGASETIDGLSRASSSRQFSHRLHSFSSRNRSLSSSPAAPAAPPKD